MPDPTDSLATFHAWSAVHWAVIGATIVISVSSAFWRRSWDHRSAAARTLDRSLAVLTFIIWIAIQVLQLVRDDFSAGTALPLHVSDLTLLAVPIALWSSSRWASAVVYCWGLSLGSLAFLIPDLRDGPAKLGFWLFWSGHVVITAAIVYEIVGRRFRPSWADFRRAATLALVYAILIVPFNAVTGHSYGYLGPDQPNQPAVLRAFGPWPRRVTPVFLTGVIAMSLVVAPWQIRRPVFSSP
jgi:hypothetical integral membrane protein (TIGR02206 family)